GPAPHDRPRERGRDREAGREAEHQRRARGKAQDLERGAQDETGEKDREADRRAQRDASQNFFREWILRVFLAGLGHDAPLPATAVSPAEERCPRKTSADARADDVRRGESNPEP